MSPPVIKVSVLTTPPSLKIKLLPKPVVQVKAMARFPASVSVISPILLDRTGANYQFSLDMNAINDMIGVSFQPVDADLTAIAALTTTAYGRSLLTLANATALAAEVDSFFLTPAEGNAAYQPLDSDLTAIAALTTTSYGRAFLALADAAATRTAIGVVIGTDVQAYDADVAALAANSTNGLWARTGAGTGAARTITGTANEVTVANGDGVSGNPTLSLPTSMTFTGKAVLGGTFTSPVFVTPTLGAATGTSLNLSGAGPTTLVLSGATPNIEMGAKASANTPYIDFNSSGNSNDYDVRLIASGGTTAGTGTLTFNGGTFAFSGTVTASTQAALDNSTKVATTAYVDAAVTAGGGGTASRNRIINPSGMIAQAGLASTADSAYTGFDQWLALTQSNAVTPSALTNVEDSTPYMMRITQANASAQRFGIIQWLETANCIDLRGQSVFLTARVRMSASTTLRYAIVEWTGTADTITKDIVNSWTNTTFTAGQFFTSTSTTIVATGSTALTANTLASISLSGTISSSQNNLAVFFWTDSTQAQNVTLDVGKVDLKRSSATSTHEALGYQEEFMRCLRYYYSIGGLNAGQRMANGFAFSTTVFACFIEYPVQMVKDPTITVSAAGDFQCLIGGGGFTPSSLSTASITKVSAGFDANVTGATAGNGGLLRAQNSNARLIFDGRL